MLYVFSTNDLRGLDFTVYVIRVPFRRRFGSTRFGFRTPDTFREDAGNITYVFRQMTCGIGTWPCGIGTWSCAYVFAVSIWVGTPCFFLA